MLDKQFDAKRSQLYAEQVWSLTDFKPKGQGAPYCIMLPPPNVTGTLHMGHGFQHTLMDALIRYHRMCGDRTLWQPGTDHAGISTQMVVENQLKKEGLDRQTLGRESFVQRVWQWKEQSGETILKQMKKLGASCDWSRLRFTMDEGLSEAVIKAFVTLYQDKKIYRGTRLVNWDPILQTALSDLEVLSEEEQGNLYYIRYPSVDKKNVLVVATTRPETLFGDVAIAVHPEDRRYQKFIGTKFSLPLTDREIPIIADDYVSQDFGSGCVKITPAHDFNDFEMGKRHALESINIFTAEAQLNHNVPQQYQGLTREAARAQVIADLTEQGLMEKVVPHRLNIPRSERTNTIVEPFLSQQWYLSMKDLAGPALEAVESGAIEFVPDNWRNTYHHWLTNIQDWCVSRQLWWGHRIPAWYDEEENIYVAHNETEAQRQAGAKKIVRQETDVLDTWFSSALWPFSTLGWPAQTPEFSDFYPTQVLVTGFDIIFFWVARMIMFGLYFTDKIPFKQVLITGLIRDQEGQKMSKSKGNVIDPIDLVDGISLDALLAKRTSGLMLDSQKKSIEAHTKKQFPQGIPAFGEDALRFTYCALATHGRDIRFDLSRCEGYRNFCNKIWNATRFIEMQLEKFQVQQLPAGLPNISECETEERWLLFYLNELIENCHRYFNEYHFDLLAEALHAFIWYQFCDTYIEKAKRKLHESNEQALITLQVLVNTLDILLRLVHPLMPFITEDIWQNSVKKVLNFPPKISEKPLMLQSYPHPFFNDPNEEVLQAKKLIDNQNLIIGAINAARNKKNVKPKERLAQVFIHHDNDKIKQELVVAGTDSSSKKLICDLAKVDDLIFGVPAVGAEAIIYDPYNIYFDYETPPISAEEQVLSLKKVKEQIEKLSTEKIKLEAVMANAGYVAKVPEAVKAKNTERLLEINRLLKESQKLIG